MARLIRDELMHLLDYMREKGLSDAAFADLFNQTLPPTVRPCSEFAVKKWKYRERRPDADGIIRIEAITDGLVALADWASTVATAGAAQ